MGRPGNNFAMALAENIKSLSLCPVEQLDMAGRLALLDVRNQKVIRDNSYHTHVIQVEEHQAWIGDMEADPTMCFFAVSRNDQIIGGAGLRGIDEAKGEAEWSFYLDQAEQGRGLGLALGVAALDQFFGAYDVTKIMGETLARNAASQNFHLKLGFEKVGQSRRPADEGARMEDIVIFGLDLPRWEAVRKRLLSPTVGS